MATLTYIGNASTVVRAKTWTIVGTPSPGDIVAMTINGKTVSYAYATGTITDLATFLVAALNASTIPEFVEVTWELAATGAVVAGTANDPGATFAAASSETGASLTFTATATTDSTGFLDLANTANYSTGSLPVGGDTLVMEKGTPDVSYNLDALSAISLARLAVYGGRIGLEDKKDSGYSEYRQKNLKLGGCTSLEIGDGSGNVDGLRLDIGGTGTTEAKVDGGNVSVGGSTGPKIRFITRSTASINLHVVTGAVGVAYAVGEVCLIGLLRVGTKGPSGSLGASDEDSSVEIGNSATVPTAYQYGGKVVSRAAGTNITLESGIWTQREGGIGTILCTGGTVQHLGAGNIGAAVFRGENAVLDLSGDSRSFTCASLSVTGGARVIDPAKRLGNIAIAFDKASLSVSDIGENFIATRS